MNAFAWTIGAGAFLLFQVQPLLAHLILPSFGGGAAVWTACLLFFQTFLLAGYAYAHASSRWLGPRGQVALHLALVGLSILFPPVAPGTTWQPTATGDPTWQIFLLLTATIGLPYLALAAMLAGVHYGLTNKLDPGPAIMGDGYAQADKAPVDLPKNWFAAVDTFASSEVKS